MTEVSLYFIVTDDGDRMTLKRFKNKYYNKIQ